MINDHLRLVVDALKERFDAQDSIFRDEIRLIIGADKLVPAVRTLRDEFGFDHLACLTVSDYWPEEMPRFHVIYQIYSYSHHLRICLRVPINGNRAVLPTIETIYPVANWHEREAWDMFGILFEGHSDLRRILMPHDWVGHPLRKDYPLGYEEPQFTFNFDEIQVRKHRGNTQEA